MSATAYIDPVSYLKAKSLGVTAAVTGCDADVDLPQSEISHLVRRAVEIARISGLSIYLLGRRGKWLQISGWIFPTMRWSGKPFEIVIVDSEKRIRSRLTLHVWLSRQSFLQNLSVNAPVKRACLPWSSFPGGERSEFASKPIDAVYTWVNADDSEWQKLYARYRDPALLDNDRYQQFDELRYSLRSADLFAPWLRRIFIFSNCKPPLWFRETERVHWVEHSAVIPAEFLPTFNSHAIETYLHEIPGLADDFIYLNDDVFFSRPVTPRDFFDGHGASVARHEPHGMLHYLTELSRQGGGIEEWQQAAVNGAQLMFSRFGIYPARLHEHAPHAFNRDVFKKMLNLFAEEARKTRLARFRSLDDVSFASFLYHHFAAANHRANAIWEPVTMIRPSNFKRIALWCGVSSRFFCVNDGGGSTGNSAYIRFKRDFLVKLYPFKSTCERS